MRSIVILLPKQLLLKLMNQNNNKIHLQNLKIPVNVTMTGII